MKTKKKRTEIVSETTTLLILKNSNVSARQNWCGKCAAEVIWIAPSAVNLSGIADLPETAALHTDGDYICSRSLIEAVKKGEKL